jgi:GNAT superfamily N-acetyltransferase
VAVEYDWRGSFANAELNALHAEAFGHRVLEDDRNSQVHRYSLGWVCARRGGGLVGFVNVAWDGGVLAFILDTVVALDARREGIGKALIAAAVAGTRAAGCCEWLHVDFEEELRPFYFDACGFMPTDAGLMALR